MYSVLQRLQVKVSGSTGVGVLGDVKILPKGFFEAVSPRSFDHTPAFIHPLKNQFLITLLLLDELEKVS